MFLFSVFFFLFFSFFMSYFLAWLFCAVSYPVCWHFICLTRLICVSLVFSVSVCDRIIGISINRMNNQDGHWMH